MATRSSSRSGRSLKRDAKGRFVSPSKRTSRRGRSSSRGRRMKRDAKGRFVSPKKTTRKGRSRSKSSRSKSTRKGRSRSRLSVKEEEALARRMGIRSLAQLRRSMSPAQRKRRSDAYKKKDKRSRDARRRARERRGERPDLNVVLKHFMMVLPESMACPRRMCKSVYEKHRQLGLLPKKPEDLALIFQAMPSEADKVNRRCWICLYRAYRDVYQRANGRYPSDAPDVSDDFGAKSDGSASLLEGVFGKGDESSEVLEGSFDYSEPSTFQWSSSAERTPKGRRKWSVSSQSIPSMLPPPPPGAIETKYTKALREVNEMCQRLTDDIMGPSDETLDYAKLVVWNLSDELDMPDLKSKLNAGTDQDAMLQNCTILRRAINDRMRPIRGASVTLSKGRKGRYSKSKGRRGGRRMSSSSVSSRPRRRPRSTRRRRPVRKSKSSTRSSSSRRRRPVRKNTRGASSSSRRRRR